MGVPLARTAFSCSGGAERIASTRNAWSDVPAGAVFRFRRKASPNGPTGGLTLGGGLPGGGFVGGVFPVDAIISSFPSVSPPRLPEARNRQLAGAAAGLARRHSARAARETRTQTRNSPARIIPSNDPMWWSGSKPVSVSIQSRLTNVRTERNPHMEASPASTQKCARTVDLTRHLFAIAAAAYAKDQGVSSRPDSLSRTVMPSGRGAGRDTTTGSG